MGKEAGKDARTTFSSLAAIEERGGSPAFNHTLSETVTQLFLGKADVFHILVVIMKKAIALFVVSIGTVNFSSLRADVGEVMKDTPVVTQSPTAVFRGTVTAIEESRNSMTVKSDDGTVKMFTLTPEQKKQMIVGGLAEVEYVDRWQWPLETVSAKLSSIPVDMGMKK